MTTPNPNNRDGWLRNALGDYTQIAFVFAGIILIIYFLFPLKDPLKKSYANNYVVDKHEVFDTSAADIYDSQLSVKRLESIRENLDSIYKDRKAHYLETAKSISSIVNGLGLCCLLAIILLYFDHRENIQLAGISIPYKSVFLVLPILMLYLWLSFGFAFFSAYDSREVCYVIAVKTDYIQDRIVSGNADSLGIENLYRIHRNFSRIHELEDVGIIDGCANFFMGFYSDTVYNHFYSREKDCTLTDKTKCFISTNSGGLKSVPVAVSLFGIFGTLLGLSLGLTVALLIYFQRLFSINSRLSSALTIAVFSLISLSFVGMISYKPQLGVFCGYIWLVAAFVLQLYSRKLKRIEDGKDPY